jgi:carboxyl-terminal processing protease
MQRSLAAILMCGAAGIALGLSGLGTRTWASDIDRYASLDTLAQALHHIERHFLGDADTQSLIYGGIKGMTQTLDRHSTFLTPADMERAEARTEGWFTGIGLELKPSPLGARIDRVIPDSPADLAGIHADQILTAIDGMPQQGEPLDDVGARLRGTEGTPVKVTTHTTESTPRTFTLTRVRVRDKAVRIFPDADGFPRIHIAHFQRNTASDLEAALNSLARRRGKVRGLVLDLRDNPGGLLDEAVAVADLFLSTGLIYETRGQDGKVMDRADAKPGDRWERTPLVVLVNKHSASASEIVAGALQAHERAKLVGTATYGKGSVQRMYIFEDGSALKLTVSRYGLANGVEVQDEHGLAPDFVVAEPSKQVAAAARLTVLAESLPEKKRTEALSLIEAMKAPEDTPPPSKTDPQLEAAWKIVRAIR